MNKFDKIYREIIIQGKDNISFNDLTYFVEKLGFKGRIKGDHHSYRMDGVNAKINIQPVGKDAKPYQVRQIRNIVKEYKMGRENNE